MENNPDKKVQAQDFINDFIVHECDNDMNKFNDFMLRYIADNLETIQQFREQLSN